MNLFLTRAEIAELTGSKLKAKQIKVLKKNGIRHYVDANDWPVVTRSAIEGEPGSAQAVVTWKPNKAA